MKHFIRKSFPAFFLTAFFVSVCLVSSSQAGLFDSKKGPKVKRDVASYEKEGRHYGEELYDKGINPESSLNNQYSQFFIEHLIGKDEIDYFGVHSDLKEAFKKGFRQGYQDRTADLVLGPHLQKAAGLIGRNSALRFKEVVENFEKGWAETLINAVNVFITLIAEGSQADREEFIRNFTEVYKTKYDQNQAVIKAGGSIRLASEGGTQLYLDPRNTISTLDIPSDKALRVEIYKQTFRVMGDEMGRRYSHNLIPRGELVDWLRRSKTALNMDQGEISPKVVSVNLGIVANAFIKSYGTDGRSVFEGLAREAGY